MAAMFIRYLSETPTFPNRQAAGRPARHARRASPLFRAFGHFAHFEMIARFH
jgi:hypothetical protein